jgi:FKBP-type peptidyl-prolyl cis-trans isomerase FkpA
MLGRHCCSGFSVVTLTLLCGFAAADNSAAEFATEQEKLFYFMGTQVGENLAPLSLSNAELELVLRGTRDAVQGDAVDLDPNVYGPLLNGLGEERHAARLATERPKAQAYLVQMAAEDGAQTIESGLIFLQLESGSGAAPTSTSVVLLNYHGSLRDGTVFDSSIDRGQPVEVPLQRVLPCWQEGVGMLKEGGKARISCPAELAYQDRGTGIVPPGAAVTFEVELIRVVN